MGKYEKGVVTMISKAKNGKFKVFASAFSSFLFLVAGVETGRGQQPQWKIEWERTIDSAKKEGKLVYHAGSAVEPVFREFQKRYPEIKTLRMLTRGGSAAAQRLMAERRAGLYAADVLVLGGTSGSRLARAGVLEPIEPNLILPEILDRSKWWQGKHHYVGKKSGYVFVFAGIPRPFIAYNTKLVDPASLRSYWDFFNPKWKGKIVSFDPAAAGRGGAGAALRFTYYNPELGLPWIRRLLGEMDLTNSRNQTQIVDWLGIGRFAIAMFVTPRRSGLYTAKAQGLPVDAFLPHHFKEGIPFSGGGNNVALVNRTAHPNAARLFINWFLSREGQSLAQKLAGGGEGVDSLRIDIAKDDVPQDYRRQKGIKYFYTDKPEWMDMKPVLNLIAEIQSKRKR